MPDNLEEVLEIVDLEPVRTWFKGSKTTESPPSSFEIPAGHDFEIFEAEATVHDSEVLSKPK